MNEAIAKLIQKHRMVREIKWIRTGIHAVDLIIGNGIPQGRILEIYGSESAGKSLLAWHIAKAFQKAGGIVILFDVEATSAKDFASKAGVDINSVIEPSRPVRTVEQVKDSMLAFCEEIREADSSIPILCIWDSIAATSAAGEWQDGDPDTNKTKANVGQRAKAMSEFFRHWTRWLSDNDITLVCVNQIREKIGVMFGKKTESPGGKAMKFHASVRIELTRGKRIPRLIDKVESIVGVECHATIEKNKMAPPFRKALLRIFWDRGFDEIDGMDELLIDMHRAKPGKGNTILIKEKHIEISKLRQAIEADPELTAPWLN